MGNIKRRLYTPILIVIAFLLFCLTSIFIRNSYEHKRIAGEEIAQKNIENYLNEKYPNNKMTVVDVIFIYKIREYHCSVKDENNIMFGTTIDENFKTTDTYIESKVEYELQNKLTPFIKELIGSINEPFFIVESVPENNKGEKFKIRVYIQLPSKEKVKTTEEFAEYVVIVRDELIKLLQNNFSIKELCIRLNTFVVGFDNTQLYYNTNEVKKIIIVNK